MTFLITGHKGFVGSNIHKYLQKREHKVDGFSRENELPNRDYDIIIHCAGITPLRAKCDFDYVQDNIILTKEIIEKYPNSKIVFLSSKEIYGTPNVETITENTMPCNQSFYSMSKYMCERLIAKTNDYIILRLPAVIGTNAPCTFVTNMLDNIVEGNKINIYNGDKKFNSIIHIDDVVSIIELLVKDSKSSNESYNIASDGYVFIRDIPIIISNQLNKKIPFIENRNTTNTSGLISVEKIKQHIKLPYTKDVIIRLCQ